MRNKANIDTEGTKRIGIPRKKEDEETFCPCEYCDYSAGTTQHLWRHIRRKHPNAEGRQVEVLRCLFNNTKHKKEMHVFKCDNIKKPLLRIQTARKTH